MTDVSPTKAHADHQPASVVSYGDAHPPPSYPNGSPALDGALEDEESSTIKCICGFSDDDGNTVLCEKCNTWQHIVCYYESPHHVPDVHECTDCSPRPVDRNRAHEKQVMRRELHSIERKGKPKAATKNPKKRTNGSVQAPNGWPVQSNNEHYYPERKSGSPRDQPPPFKRPKTNHRTSGSMSVLGEAPALALSSRKRASSTTHNGHSPPKSPSDDPDDRFSPQFMNLYRQPDPPTIDLNSFTDIRVTNDFSTWCNDREALAEATGGLQPGQVFQRIDQSIDDLNSLAPPIIKQEDKDPSITAHGLHPQWKYLIVDNEYERMVPAQSYIGEVKGRIGRKVDYCADPTNRWESLRHPEPFVFFPPHLPIYIDTRQEGSGLRYIRRSCDPNVQMKIMTHDVETGLHFCLIATKDIEPGEELTIGWEIDSEIRQEIYDSLHTGDIHREGLKKIQPWVACILANFGGCACDKRGRVCLLDHVLRPSALPTKSTKGRKAKKSHVSPVSTGHAANSRAGSEGIHRMGAEDEHNMDARSTSGSRKSTSRDITPATHLSVDGEPKISDRERRKIEQQERLFERLEHNELHKGRKGKRSSAGSNLNTPSIPSSKRLGHSEHSPSARNLREHTHGVARKASGTPRANGRVVQPPKRVYVETATQTDDTLPDPPRKKKVVPPPRMSFKKRLIQEALEDTLEAERRAAIIKAEAKSPALQDLTSNNASPVPPPVSAESNPAHISHGPEPMDISTTGEAPVISMPSETKDVDMKDSDTPKIIDDHASVKSAEESNAEPEAHNPELASGVLQPPKPPPLFSSTPSMSTVGTLAEAPSPQMVDASMQPPPPESTNSAVSTGSVAGGPIAQSPVATSTTVSPFSPVANPAPTPGPARKKLSLSDYTNRRAKLAAQSSVSATPPLTQPLSTSSPTLSTASLPAQASTPAKTPEPLSLPTVTEESTTTAS